MKMKKILGGLLTVIVGLSITGAIIWIMSRVSGPSEPDTSSSQQTQTDEQPEATQQQTTTPEQARIAAQQEAEETKQQAAEASRYVDYTPEAFAASTTEKNVISFDATWCYVCDAIEKNILNGEIPVDLTIFKADFDTEIELRKKYGVTTQTTFVQVTPQGDEITKWVMYDVNAGIDDIVAMLQ